MAETASTSPAMEAQAGVETKIVSGPARNDPLRPQSVATARAARAGADAGERQRPREMVEFARTLRAVQAELGQLRAKTDDVNRSVQFTEAHLSIGLPERMAEVLRTDVAAADRWRNAHTTQERRTRRARMAAVVLGAALLLELQTGWASPLYEAAGRQAAEVGSGSMSILRERFD